LPATAGNAACSIGDSVSFHRAVQAEMQSADAFAERVGGLCDPRTIVLSDHTPQISSHIYGWPGHWTAEEGKLHRFSTLTARDGSARLCSCLCMRVGLKIQSPQSSLSHPEEYKLVRDPAHCLFSTKQRYRRTGQRFRMQP